MALFREHVSVGALIAMVGIVCAYHYAFVTDWRLLLTLFVVTVVASFMPDLDSDTGVPFYLVFGLFTLVCGGVALLYTLTIGATSTYELFGRPLLVVALVWFIAGGMFKHLTHHRGMLHSVPAMLIMALAVLLTARAFGASDFRAFLLAVGAGVGYLSHLVLDELHSSVSINGNPFHHRASLGTALKFVSSSRVANVFTYTLLAVLVYVAV